MTDFLYSQSDVLSGAGSVLDLFGVLPAYTISENAKEADRRAFQADLLALRSDMDATLNLVLPRG